MNKMIEATEATFASEVLHASTPVLVDFYTPWCGPCKMLAPMLESLATELGGNIKFVKVNVDDAPELSRRFAIAAVPTLMLFDNGEVVDTIVGAPDRRALKARLESATARSAAAAPGACCVRET